MSGRIGLIWAEARDGAIGRAGGMPWHLPEDLAHFKATTMGEPVIMGRRTWDSLPERFRPLPGRENVVVTRDPAFIAGGARVAGSLDEALRGGTEQNGGDSTAWVIGGGELFQLAMPLATDLVVTRIALEVDGADTFAPAIGPEWTLVDSGEPLVSKTGLGYRFERYRRGPERSDTLDG